MALFIHDAEVDALAVELQKLTKARSKTAAVRRALVNEIERTRKEIPVSDRLEKARAMARELGATDQAADLKALSDDLSGGI